MDLHDRQVERISLRQSVLTEHNLPGSFDGRPVYRKYFIDDPKQSIERRLNGIGPLDRNITVTVLVNWI